MKGGALWGQLQSGLASSTLIRQRSDGGVAQFIMRKVLVDTVPLEHWRAVRCAVRSHGGTISAALGAVVLAMAVLKRPGSRPPAQLPRHPAPPAFAFPDLERP